MSAKTSKRNSSSKSSNALVATKKTTTQNRKGRGRAKKPAKSVIMETINITEVASPQPTKVDQAIDQDSPLKNKVKALIQLVEQAEYYPDKLKRDIRNKKIVLKPKHNFKIIATANKRKLAIPQKGGLPSISSNFTVLPDNINNSSEMSMIDMVQLIEENHNLSDEDFMEILTCPSPVWWEDPPDESYIEDPISTRYTESPSTSKNDVNKIQPEIQNETVNTIRTKFNKPRAITKKNKLKNEIKHTHATKLAENNTEKFNNKKQKLENILGNIKMVKQCDEDNMLKKDALHNDGVSSDRNTPIKSRRCSNSADDNMSDISFNEEEILDNLENIDIPMQQHSTNRNMNKDEKNKKSIENCDECKTENNLTKPRKSIKILSNKSIIIPDILPPLKRKPDVKENKIVNDNPDSYSGYNLDYVSHSKFRFISDDDVSAVETFNLDTSVGEEVKNIKNRRKEGKIPTINVTTFKNRCDVLKKDLIDTKNDKNSDKSNALSVKSSADDLSEYITVYKIASSSTKNKRMVTKLLENPKTEVENGKGKLNTFFKKCKSNKRLKTCEGAMPSLPVSTKNFEIMKQNGDKNDIISINVNQLKSNSSVAVFKKGSNVKNLKYRKASNFSCDNCNFQTNANESYNKHLSSCREVNRISWKQVNS